MKLKFVLGIMTLLMINSCVCSAAPLMEYKVGSASVSLGGMAAEGYSFHGPAANSGYGSLTVGLGKNFALDLRRDNFRQNNGSRLSSNEVNLMYQVIPNVSVYGGYAELETKDLSISECDENNLQAGIRVALKLPMLFTVWADGSYGVNSKGFEAGISRPIVRGLELDVAYYQQDGYGDSESKSKGIKTGLTYRF